MSDFQSRHPKAPAGTSIGGQFVPSDATRQEIGQIDPDILEHHDAVQVVDATGTPGEGRAIGQVFMVHQGKFTRHAWVEGDDESGYFVTGATSRPDGTVVEDIGAEEVDDVSDGMEMAKAVLSELDEPMNSYPVTSGHPVGRTSWEDLARDAGYDPGAGFEVPDDIEFGMNDPDVADRMADAAEDYAMRDR